MFPVLECSMMIVLCYLPYLLAEALALSGIVAILTAAVVMSHYTHGNLSPVTQACISLSHCSKKWRQFIRDAGVHGASVAAAGKNC
jgi:NhaP-type Na+/H+ or K+/H+ antiporter